MPEFIIEGARKDDGREARIKLEAEDATQAEQIASIRGVFVSTVRPADTPTSSVPYAAPASNPLSSPAQMPAPGRAIAIIAVGVILGVIGLALIAMFAGGVIGISAGGTVSGTSTPALSYTDRAFLTALRAQDISAVKRALQDEPNLKVVDPESGETPLVLVIDQLDSTGGADWWELAKAILKAGADVNGNGRYGKAPLKNARAIWTMKFLLDNGAKVDGDASSGTALYWKDADVWYDEAAFLLSRGADPNAVNFEGQTPLHNAAANNATKIISLLLKSGAQVNKRDNKGYTPLRRARLSIQKEAAQLLEQNGGTE